MIIASELEFPEGPLRLKDGSWLVTEMDPGHVTHIRPDGSKRTVVTTGAPNGLALADDGSVWVAESLHPALMRLDLMTGEAAVALQQVDGVALRWPNDLCFGPDGAIYATDSGILRSEFTGPGWPPEESVDGRVIRFDPRSREAWFVDVGLRIPNGLAFGPDGLLYVNETRTGDVYRYRLKDGRATRSRELFSNVLDPALQMDTMRGPDGMAFSSDGRLWVVVFGQGTVTVLDTDGKTVDRIALPGHFPTNCAFGKKGQLHVVESETGTMLTLDVDAEGLQLHG